MLPKIRRKKQNGLLDQIWHFLVGLAFCCFPHISLLPHLHVYGFVDENYVQITGKNSEKVLHRGCNAYLKNTYVFILSLSVLNASQSPVFSSLSLPVRLFSLSCPSFFFCHSGFLLLSVALSMRRTSLHPLFAYLCMCVSTSKQVTFEKVAFCTQTLRGGEGVGGQKGWGGSSSYQRRDVQNPRSGPVNKPEQRIHTIDRVLFGYKRSP